MVKQLSILIIDLSGYTALTELHGGKKAAEVVRYFEQLVNAHLLGDCEIFERKGDEIIITSAHADSLMDLILNLKAAINQTNEFPTIHAGLHFGDVYQDKNQLFGTTINLASRIQGFARTGQVFVSEIFFKNLSLKKRRLFHEYGKVGFKNILSQVNLYILNQTFQKSKMYIDPVCRMQVRKNKLSYTTESGEIFHLCSKECLDSLRENPESYIH